MSSKLFDLWRSAGVALLCALLSASLGAAEPLVVHEWGTFTALQDENGRQLAGVNVDDEPVPAFVHNLSGFLLNRQVLSSQHWIYRSKAVPRRHPLVTVRLETPVIYFYPPKGQSLPMELDVAVKFRGGWLSEYYPQASATAPGLADGAFRFGQLTRQTVGTLTWRRLQIGVSGTGPETDAHVWLAPRKVNSAQVATLAGECERYLFYRGVGNLRVPLSVSTDLSNRTLTIRGNFDEVLGDGRAIALGRMWLADIRGDGATAMRTFQPIPATSDTSRVLATVSADFREEDYANHHLGEMKQAMHHALVEDGLFDDEATAMLATWERAYFQSPGLRLFFLVPRVWTDHFLPLSLSAPANVERVMVGRIELITPGQRQLLAQLARADVSDGRWLASIPDAKRIMLLSGRSGAGELGIEMPVDFRAYYSLGRFRNALLTAEEQRRPSPSLTQFINSYQLQAYRWQPEQTSINQRPAVVSTE